MFGISFAKYLFIYLFKKNEAKQFQIEFFRISTVKEQACKVHLLLRICNNNPMILRQ